MVPAWAGPFSEGAFRAFISVVAADAHTPAMDLPVSGSYGATALDTVRAHIKLRLYDETSSRGLLGVSRHYIPGLNGFIVIDQDNAREVALPETVASWGMSEDDL